MKIIFLAMPRNPIRITCKSMYTGMLLAFELYKAKRDDLISQAEKYRLSSESRSNSSAYAPVLKPRPAKATLSRA